MKYYPLLCFFELDRSWGWCALTKISMIVIVVIFLQPKLIFLDQLGAGGGSEPIPNFCQNWSKQGVPLTVNSCRPKWQWRWWWSRSASERLEMALPGLSAASWSTLACFGGFPPNHPTNPPTHLPTSPTRALGSLAGSCLIRVLASKWQIFLLPSISVRLKQ